MGNRTRLPCVPRCPGPEDQHLARAPDLGELLGHDMLRTEAEFEQPGQRLARGVGRIRPDHAIPPQVALGDQARRHEPLDFAVDRGERSSDLAREVGEAELLVRVQQHQGEQLSLSLTAEDRQQCRRFTSHN